MRTALTMSVAAVAIGLGTISLRAAPTGIAAMPNATPLTQLVQDNYDYYGSYTTGWGWRLRLQFHPGLPGPLSLFLLAGPVWLPPLRLFAE